MLIYTFFQYLHKDIYILSLMQIFQPFRKLMPLNVICCLFEYFSRTETLSCGKPKVQKWNKVLRKLGFSKEVIIHAEHTLHLSTHILVFSSVQKHLKATQTSDGVCSQRHKQTSHSPAPGSQELQPAKRCVHPLNQ